MSASAPRPRLDTDPILSGGALLAAGTALVLLAIAANLPALFSIATVLLLLGWSISYLVIGRYGASAITPTTVSLPVLLSIGLFYFQGSHEDHIRSGIGFGLDHTTHNLIGFVILVVLAVVTVVLARRTLRAARAEERRSIE